MGIGMNVDGRIGPVLTHLAGDVGHLIREIFATLSEGAAEVEELWLRRGIEKARAEDLGELIPGILRRLKENENFFGTGFVAAPEVLAGRYRYQEWWQRSGQEVAFLSAEDMTISHGEVYDYTVMPWFVGAKSGTPTVHGPYIDVEGSNEYVLTFAVPVVAGGKFVGVAAADVAVVLFEETFLRVRSSSGVAVLLVSHEDRVIASGSAQYSPGERARLSVAGPAQLGGPGVRWHLALVPTASGV